MEEKQFVEKKYIWIPVLLMLGAILVNIKSIFTDFDVDSQYALVMAYRFVNGDKMITQMWEPHQSSVFLCALFVKVYIILFKTTTGIVLYLHAVGVVLKAICTYCLHRTLKKYLKPVQVFLICIFFFSIFPKGLPMPEFSNMMIWFSVGLYCCLICFFFNQDKKRWLLLAAVFLCLLVLAYPSCVIVYIGVIILLFCYTKKKWKNMMILTGVCAGIGGFLLCWIVSAIGINRFVQNIGYIMTGDLTHSTPLINKVGKYIYDFGEMILLLFCICVLAMVITGVVSFICQIQGTKCAKQTKKTCWTILFWSLILIYYIVHTLMVIDRYNHLVIYVPIILAAIVNVKACTVWEKKLVYTGLVISVFSFGAALILSNLPLSASMSYLELAVCVSFIPLTKYHEKYLPLCNSIVRHLLLWLFCFLTVFRSGYIFKPMNAYVDSIFNLGGYVKDGPAKGIISEYMGPYVINISMQEWKEYVRPGDCILLVGRDAVSVLGYMYEDTKISVDSTISTPTYDEKLLIYWENNPEKYPDMVIIDSWNGQLSVDENSWIIQWLNEEFQPTEYVDGQHWRYYRAE